MKNQRGIVTAVAGLLLAVGAMGVCRAADGEAAPAQPIRGWLNWRGPEQTGVSRETHLPDTWKLGGKNDLWSIDLPGRGTPVIVGDRVYAWGYRGHKEDLREWLTCLDANTGKTIWEHPFDDFISDVIYDRYAIGAPTIDPDTGNIYLLTTARELVSLTPDGKIRWRHSLMEEFGVETFPNGRTGAPVISGHLVMVNTISTNWGAEGPPRDRFYAFDKDTGEPVWSSTPGVGPPFLKDSSFSTPIIADDAQGRRVFYCGIGSGAVVCCNANTGQPIWRYQVAVGGLNSSVLVYKDTVIAIHGVQNTDNTRVGAMVAIKRNATPKPAESGAPLLGTDALVWQNNLEAFSSSPVLVGNRVFVTVRSGELCDVDADTGKVLWKKKLGPDQIHASPLWADGKLYIPLNNGTFWIIKPSDKGAEVLDKVQLEGNCLGAPAVWNGKIYVFTTQKLYCFGYKDNSAHLPPPTPPLPAPKLGPIASLQIVPDEILLTPGSKVKLHVTALDAEGHPVAPVHKVEWEKWIPPTAKVHEKMDASFTKHNEMMAAKGAHLSAGAIQATALELPAAPASTTAPVRGHARGRVLEDLPYHQDFEKFDLTVPHPGDNVKFAYPPLAWIGARFKWDVREVDGSKVLAKTLDRLILQRSTVFIGDAHWHDYTMSADVRTDGNRRLMSEVGLVNQRYKFDLMGNYGKIEITSNYERLKADAPFKIKPKVWYRLKTQVLANKDGSGTVRAKVWTRGENEPADWTISVPVKHVHPMGSPGLFGFSLGDRFAVYIDNIDITPNK